MHRIVACRSRNPLESHRFSRRPHRLLSDDLRHVVTARCLERLAGVGLLALPLGCLWLCWGPVKEECVAHQEVDYRVHGSP